MMQQTTDYNTLSAQIVILNSTIYAQVGELNVKIMLVNTTIYSELDLILSNLTNIYEILNISSGNATSFTQYVNNSLITITGDINNLQMNVSYLYGNITVLQGSITDIYSNLTVVWGQLDNLEATKLETINGVPGDSVNKNVNLVSVNDNMYITVDVLNNTVFFNVSESLMHMVTENGTVTPTTGGEMYIVGGPTNLIDVTGLFPSQIVIDASNVQLQLNNQAANIAALSMEVMSLQSNVSSLDARVTVLENFILNIINLNITGNLNASIATLIYNVTVLQAQVVDLQTQINNINANTSAVPIGTIVPYGGDNAMIPTGYLLCDGSPYLIAGTYNQLFLTIGSGFCQSPYVANMTHFCVPNLLGRVPVGQTTVMGQFATRGAFAGDEEIFLNTLQSPVREHTHPITSLTSTSSAIGSGLPFASLTLNGNDVPPDFSGTNGPFNCEWPAWTNCGGTCSGSRTNPSVGQAILTCSNTVPTNNYVNSLELNPVSPTHSHTTSGNTQNPTATNGTSPVPLVQPSLVVNYIIKY